MSNEVVKFSNQFNNQALRQFNAIHLDLLMAIAARVRDKNTDEVVFTFDELKKIAHIKHEMSTDTFAATVLDVNRRLLALNFTFEDGSKTIQFPLFTKFVTDKNEANLSVRVNQEFAFLLNDLTSEFTRFELKQFADLRSSYAKECYRRLKQYRQTGMWRVSVKDFRTLLDVPESYDTSHLTAKVIKPILAELQPLMNLTLERKYKKTSSGRGRGRLDSFIWRFDREYTPGQAETIERKAVERKEREAKRAEENSKPKFDIEQYKAEHDGRTPRQQAMWLAEQE